VSRTATSPGELAFIADKTERTPNFVPKATHFTKNPAISVADCSPDTENLSEQFASRFIAVRFSG
jgi:hypothetical protein